MEERQGYRDSTDHTRAGWFVPVREKFVVWLKKSGIAGADRFETTDYSTATGWITEFLETGQYPGRVSYEATSADPHQLKIYESLPLYTEGLLRILSEGLFLCVDDRVILIKPGENFKIHLGGHWIAGVFQPDFNDEKQAEPYDFVCGPSFCGLRSGMRARLTRQPHKMTLI